MELEIKTLNKYELIYLRVLSESVADLGIPGFKPQWNLGPMQRAFADLTIDNDHWRPGPHETLAGCLARIMAEITI